VRVPVRTLDAELGDATLPSPTILKLDVQGYERWVLDGASRTLQRVDLLLMEASFRPLYHGEPPFLALITMVRDLGYDLLCPLGWLTSPVTGECLQCDLLFARRYLSGEKW
jgi:hypothetical protein